VNFSRVTTLEEMVGHIYGRTSLFVPPSGNQQGESARSHMFLREIELYIDYLRDQIKKLEVGLSSITPAYVHEFKENLLAGITHYRRLAGHLAASLRTIFLESLARQQQAVEDVPELA
jgi:hypothetical protein